MDDRGAARVGGQVTNPGGTERLHEYWVHGAGAAKIRWGSPGDYDRCVLHLSKFLKDAHGYCADAHHAALGIWPATHAAMEHAGRATVTTTQRAEMTSASINDLPDSAFAYIEPGGKKDTSGKTIPRSLRHFPVHDKAHAANALSRAPQSPFGDKAMPKIKAAAKKFGVDVSSDNGSSNGASRAEFMRMYPLENIEILRSEKNADGHEAVIVEAYAAVFGEAAEIKDHEGHYIEEIDRAAFDTAIQFAARQPGGFASNIKVLYNHGLTVQGTPAPEFQLPIGVPVDIKPEERGLLTRTQYDAEDQFVQRLLGKIRQGSISAQSFVGRIIRSDPSLSRGDQYRPDHSGNLRTVRRMKLGLREYGPVLWPAYSGAEILGVRMSRMSTPGGALDPDEEINAEALPPDEGLAAAGGDPLPEEHSARYHQHALYRLRSQKLREEAGLDW
jgi:phage head maturation protease